MNDLKIYIPNALTFAAAQFSTIDNFLKIMLLVVTIGYTAQRWYNINKNNKTK